MIPKNSKKSKLSLWLRFFWVTLQGEFFLKSLLRKRQNRALYMVKMQREKEHSQRLSQSLGLLGLSPTERK